VHRTVPAGRALSKTDCVWHDRTAVLDWLKSINQSSHGRDS
jgi:hypothetical protein